MIFLLTVTACFLVFGIVATARLALSAYRDIGADFFERSIATLPFLLLVATLGRVIYDNL